MSVDMPCKEEYAKALSAFIQEDYATALTTFIEALAIVRKFQLENVLSSKSFDPLIIKIRHYIADILFELGMFPDARENYLLIGALPQAAYTLIFEHKLDEALKLYHSCPYSPASKWGVFLCQLLKDEISIFNPGYLAYRLFLETTVSYFIRFKMSDYLEVMILAAKDIEPFFPEYLKCLGSAYLASSDYPAAILIFEESLKQCDFDAEVFYKLAQCYMLTGNKNKALENFTKTLKFLPSHIPTLKYLEKIK